MDTTGSSPARDVADTADGEVAMIGGSDARVKLIHALIDRRPATSPA